MHASTVIETIIAGQVLRLPGTNCFATNTIPKGIATKWESS